MKVFQLENGRIPCSRCGALNEKKDAYCYDCGTLLNVSTTSEKNKDIQNTDYVSTSKFTGPERHFIFETTRGDNIDHNVLQRSSFNTQRLGNTIARISSADTNFFTFERTNTGIQIIFIFIFVFAIVEFILLLISPVFIIIGSFFLIYIGILLVTRFIYFNVYDTRPHSDNTTDLQEMRVIQLEDKNYKIGLKGNYFGIKNKFTRKDWVLADKKGTKICSTNFINGYEGSLETSDENYNISSVTSEKKGIYYKDVRSFSVYNKSGVRMITIENSPLDIRLPKRFQIITRPEMDERILMFFSFVILMKLLHLQ